jgi:prephenate dehydrogenase
MRRAGVVGLGLIGGSIAKALKQKLGFSISASNRSLGALTQAKYDGVADRIGIWGALDENGLKELFSGCEAVFVCTPVNFMPECLNKLRGAVDPGCLLTDCGSTKKTIIQRAGLLGLPNFVGGHPMAGSEKIGYQNSAAHLFENAYYVTVPAAKTAPGMVDRLSVLAKGIGAVPVLMDETSHDKAVAAISHGPHAIASALVGLVEDSDQAGAMRALAAGGFKDLTRIASSSPEMWAAICMENKIELAAILRDYQNRLSSFTDLLETSNNAGIFQFFSKAKEYRDSFAQAPSAYRQDQKIRVDVEDKPGSIATISTMLSVNGINIKNIGVLHSREYEGGILEISFDSRESMAKSRELLSSMNYRVYD